MRKTGLLFALVVLAAGAAWTQEQPASSTDQDPTSTKPLPPTPDKDGVYRLSPWITPPVLVNAVPAAYPPDAIEQDRPRNIILSVVVAIDGTPTSVHLVNLYRSPFDDSAIAAVQQSRFQPGTLNGQPVPVLVHVRVPFFHLVPAIPRVQLHYTQAANSGPLSPADPYGLRPGDTPPMQIKNVSPEYSEQARRRKIRGAVVVSVLVTAEGEPTDIHVEKSLGYGLDEKAIEAASQYLFKPGMRDGNPVPMRIMIEMNFRLY